MEIAVKSLFLSLNPKIVSHRYSADVSIPKLSCKRASFRPPTRWDSRELLKRRSYQYSSPVFAVLSGVEDVGVSSSQFEDFVVTSAGTNEARELKLRVEVSGAKTRAIFNDVFDKMVAAAQPIPGFRRVKGGETPNIPRDILLEILGPTKVYKEVITKIINSTIAEYVEQEGLKVSKDLRVEQSFEDLEELFEPDEKFSFDAVIQLQETD
ncbi:trigger factor-like [Melia azedarach]|uniref:Trigger factor-like n=1 Tax=Melia azedarach TaxID=155640 RepID=A0ACC1YJQ2_MELAZ|nr:trigger factor-like [Melia azedarach]